MSAKDNHEVEPQATEASQEEKQQYTGRSVFTVSTTRDGISVQTAFLTEDGQLLNFPAVFPDLAYAMDQIEQLRHLVTQRFDQAAQVGAKAIAQIIELEKQNAELTKKNAEATEV